MSSNNISHISQTGGKKKKAKKTAATKTAATKTATTKTATKTATTKTATKTATTKAATTKVAATKTATTKVAATKVAKVVAGTENVDTGATTDVTESTTPSLGDAFTELLGQLQTLRSSLTAVTGQVRSLQKRSDRELKSAQKASKKRARRSGNRKPSGFVKPTKISGELADFLGKPKGTEMARTEVTREINGYIRLHNLQDPANGRIILADDKLSVLLKLTDGDELTYFNLQRYMSPHFAKKSNVVVTGAATE